MRNLRIGRMGLPATLSAVLFAASVMSIPSLCQAGSSENPDAFWHENTELRAMRCLPDAGGVIAAEDKAPYAEVFDSADFQTMLVMQRNWPVAFTLNLATGDVHQHPTSEVIGTGGKLLEPSPGEFVTTFLTSNDGGIQFGNTEFDYAVEPLPPLVGELSRADLERRQPAYLRRTLDYQPKAQSIAALKAIQDDIEIIAFFGTWCLICKHTLPALLATLDAAATPADANAPEGTAAARFHLTLIGTDEDLSFPEDWIVEYSLEFTPTIVVLKQGVELGRIEEEPLESVEEDLVSILSAAASR